MSLSLNDKENEFIASKLRPYMMNQDLTKIYTLDNYDLNESIGYFPQLKIKTFETTIDDEATDETFKDMTFEYLKAVDNMNLNADITKIHILQNYPLVKNISINGINNVKEIFLNDNIPIISKCALSGFNHTLINFPKKCELIDNNGLGTNTNLKIWCYNHNSSLLLNAGYDQTQLNVL
jgi:hypothetical protein